MRLSFIALRFQALIWLSKALIRRYHPFLLFGFLAGILVFSGAIFINSFLISQLGQFKTQRIGMVGNHTPTNFPLKIQQLLSFGLTELTPAGEATSAAAIKWEVDDKGELYSFYLKQGLFWQDGKEFKAGDVNYNLKDAEIVPLDDYTIQIKLKEPFSPLPILLSQPLFRQGLVGLGGYKVDSLKVENNYLTALRLSPTLSTGEVKPIEYKFYSSEENLILAYKLGEVDVIEGVHDLATFSHWPVKVESKKMEDFYVALFYNTEDGFLSQKNVRQALTYAIPTMAEVQISSPLRHGSWAYNSSAKKYNYDLDLAKKLLFEPDTATKSTNKTITISTTPEYENLAKQISQSWGSLKIDVKLDVKKEVPSDFKVLLIAQEIPTDPDQYSLWHSTQKKTNITRYKNPRIDKLLEDGRKLVDREQRKKKYFDFQKYLIDDIPAAFLYHPQTYTISRR